MKNQSKFSMVIQKLKNQSIEKLNSEKTENKLVVIPAKAPSANSKPLRVVDVVKIKKEIASLEIKLMKIEEKVQSNKKAFTELALQSQRIDEILISFGYREDTAIFQEVEKEYLNRKRKADEIHQMVYGCNQVVV